MIEERIKLSMAYYSIGLVFAASCLSLIILETVFSTIKISRWKLFYGPQTGDISSVEAAYRFASLFKYYLVNEALKISYIYVTWRIQNIMLPSSLQKNIFRAGKAIHKMNVVFRLLHHTCNINTIIHAYYSYLYRRFKCC